jgi:NAD(P) transhydrogenase subunit alpha
MSDGLLLSLYIFILASLAGFEVISKVPPILHTPLMSGSNAISGITIVGALIVSGSADNMIVKIFGFLAIVLATINVVGAYLITDRMLKMFTDRKNKGAR